MYVVTSAGNIVYGIILGCLLYLYVSLMRPHLEYACAMQDPHTKRDMKGLKSLLLESVLSSVYKNCTSAPFFLIALHALWNSLLPE